MLAFDLVRGSIRIERSRTPEVEVIARRHAVRSDPMSVTMRVDTTAEGLSFIASHPPMPPLSAGSRHDCLPPEDDRGDFWHSDVRVELLVRVPDGVRVLARVMSGDIDVAPVAAELDLTTNTGAVRIADPEGGVRASTGSGDVELRLASPATRLARGAIRLEAYYGSVRLVAAGDAPRSLRWTGARGGGVSGRLAPGGRALSAEAVHGTVSWDIARD
ncbi:MAG TPA: hypothetical protein VFS44_14240 [Gemmatimonadaceae bacterium]|nr:hypothetical protein [Gemmatimonadaceae bacterium]